MLIRSEHRTVGSYELDIFLVGDANGDFQVDQRDLDQIRDLRGIKLNDPRYLSAADVNRNGVINSSDLQQASRNLGASTRRRVEVGDPADQFLEPGSLSLVGVSRDSFNAPSAPLQFILSGTAFYQSLDEVELTINGNRVPSASLAIETHTITATSVLFDGRNEVSLSAIDTLGRPLYFNTTIWAGSNTLHVDLLDENGLPFTGSVNVRASLSDDQSVSAQASTTTGSVEFQNVPGRTMLIQASASDNHFGLIGVLGWQGFAQIRMLGFDTPSTVDNNDFSEGTDGWDIGAVPIQIVPHVEGLPGQLGPTAPASIPPSETATQRSPRDKPRLPVAAQQPISAASLASTASSIVDNDLILYTSGEGEQSISRTFNTNPGTSAVRIRYRFITSEVPGGYFGSEYNDYFDVALRSQQGGFAGESNSMNGLGLGAFDYTSGATDWRNVTLQVNPQGDVIQVDVGVANVGDGALDSQVVIDFVEEVGDQVRPSLAWNNTQGGMDLSFRVENGNLAQATTIDVYWADGTGYGNRIGSPIFSYAVPAGTPQGQHGPIHINGNLLADNPAGVTHLIATSSATNVGALADVQLVAGANANVAVIWDRTNDIIKDGLRAAGQSTATIMSTTRTAEAQARAMFYNLVNPSRPISVNVANQLGLYSPSGDAVINTFVNQTQGMTYQEIMQNQDTIRAAMLQEINNQGCYNVSHHCGDPALLNVVDIAAGVFNPNNHALFVNAVQGRVSRFFDEPYNGCYHLEVQ
jgi:hypothetical protein